MTHQARAKASSKNGSDNDINNFRHISIDFQSISYTNCVVTDQLISNGITP